MIKKVLGIFLSFVIIILGILPVNALTYDNCVNFLGSNSYDAVVYNFSDGRSNGMGKLEYDGSNIVLVPASDISLLNRNFCFLGKTYFSTDLLMGTGANFNINIDGKCVAAFNEQSGAVNCNFGGENIGSFAIGKWAYVELMIDLASKNIEVSVTQEGNVQFYRNVNISDLHDWLSDISLSSDGDLKIDNMTVKRAIKSYEDAVVIDEEDGYITAFSPVESNESLYIARYRDNILLDSNAGKCAGGYAEACVPKGENGDEYKAFIWDENLSPAEIQAIINRMNEEFVLGENDFYMFPAEKPYYIHNGVKMNYDGAYYVPFMYGNHLYSDANIIKNVTGLEIKTNEILFNGDKIARFNSQSGAVTPVSDSAFNVNMKNGLYAVDDLCKLLGFTMSVQEDVLCLTRGEGVDINDYKDDLFESIIDRSRYGYYNWETNQQLEGSSYDSSTGIYSANAVQTMMAAFTFVITDDMDGNLYDISFDVMYSDDAENILPYTAVYTTKDGVFSGMIGGTGVSGKSGEWTRVHSYVTKYNLATHDHDKEHQIVVGVSNAGGAAKGKLHFKNLSVREVSILNESEECEITCEKFASWHKLGEAVKFITEDERINQFENIRGVIYNLDGEQVFEKTISRKEFIVNGWTWTPDELGYYDAQFYGIRKDGSENFIVTCYSMKDKGSYHIYTLPSRGVAVVDGEAKPMEERSDLLMLSDNAYDDDMMKLADMIGFSGIRIHGVTWGTSGAYKGFHTASGQFDWTHTDQQINNIKRYGFKNVVANIFSTPKWAVTRNDISDSDYTSTGMYIKNCYPPTDPSVTTEGFGAYAERYKNDIDGIEIWNEPTYGNTAFWYNGNDLQSFVTLTKNASDGIRANAPNLKIYSAGFNLASGYFDQLLGYDDFKNSFDAISFHGRYADAEPYREVFAKHNITDVDLMQSEGYFYAYYDRMVPKDYRINNMVMYMHYFQHIKQGVEYATYFSMTDGTLDEVRVHTNGWNCCGLFRYFPYIEPHQGAVVAYNMFKNFGKDISYQGEYDFGNGIKGVSLISDGNPQVYVWNSDDKDFSLPSELLACVDSETVIKDFEGKTVNKTDTFKAKRMYCINNANKEKLSLITNKIGAALDSDFVGPYYTCKTAEGSTPDYFSPVKGSYTHGALFDKETFSANANVSYNTQGGVWRSETTQDISAKYALSFDDSGMYLMAVVDDNNYNATASQNVEYMIKHDGLRFAIDCHGSLQSKDRTEFFAGKYQGQPTLYKYYDADKNEALPMGCSPSKTILSSDYIDITTAGTKTTYKIFIPYSELYPFAYGNTDGDIRFAIAFTDDDFGTYKGALTFGDGLVSNLPEVWRYSILNLFSDMTINLGIENEKLVVSGNAPLSAKRIASTVYCDNALVNIYETANNNGTYSFVFPVDAGKRYTVYVGSKTTGVLSDSIQN